MSPGPAAPTLEFGDDGSVGGHASCNRFHGTATIGDGAIAFGPLAATRKACEEPIMRQEDRYLSLLREAERYELREASLFIFTAGRFTPLRFVRLAADQGDP